MFVETRRVRVGTGGWRGWTAFREKNQRKISL
jgi:hypothetical protein